LLTEKEKQPARQSTATSKQKPEKEAARGSNMKSTNKNKNTIKRDVSVVTF
jgi:hypothetical protein